MAVTAEKVKELRERTGVGMGKCKEALEQVGGDMEKAIDFLRKSGMASAVKKEGRETKEGLIGSAESATAIALVEVNAETDFVTQNEKFKEFLQEVSQIAAEKKPASLDDLLAHNSKKDPSLTIDQYRALVIQSLGENIQLKRMQILSKSADSSIGFYSHMGGKIVSVVVLAGAAGQEALARNLAIHVAAEAPDYLMPDEVPADVKAREEEIARGQVKGKPENIIGKIVEGKLKAYYDQVCLLLQKYMMDTNVTVKEMLESESKRLGKTITLKSFIRWKVGV